MKCNTKLHSFHPNLCNFLAYVSGWKGCSHRQSWHGLPRRFCRVHLVAVVVSLPRWVWCDRGSCSGRAADAVGSRRSYETRTASRKPTTALETTESLTSGSRQRAQNSRGLLTIIDSIGEKRVNECWVLNSHCSGPRLYHCKYLLTVVSLTSDNQLYNTIPQHYRSVNAIEIPTRSYLYFVNVTSLFRAATSLTATPPGFLG